MTQPIPITALTPFVPLADVPALLAASEPRQLGRRVWPAFAAAWIVLLVLTAAASEPAHRSTVQLFTWGVSLAMVVFAWSMAKSFKDELRTLSRVDDLLFLRREPEAAVALHVMMSRPMRTGDNRLRAIAQLASALASLDRTDEAIVVYDTLLELPQLAGPAGAGLKLDRTFAVLKADHLYDADRGIIDLRRLVKKWAERRPDFLPDDAPLTPGDHLAARLKLLELYRDVKTGHAEEALQNFDADLPLLRAALGHSVADAYALVAVAHDQLSRPDLAAAHFAAATTLKPPAELAEKYAEVRKIAGKYPSTLAPSEMGR